MAVLFENSPTITRLLYMWQDLLDSVDVATSENQDLVVWYLKAVDELEVFLQPVPQDFRYVRKESSPKASQLRTLTYCYSQLGDYVCSLSSKISFEMVDPSEYPDRRFLHKMSIECMALAEQTSKLAEAYETDSGIGILMHTQILKRTIRKSPVTATFVRILPAESGRPDFSVTTIRNFIQAFESYSSLFNRRTKRPQTRANVFALELS